ncbi:MAG: hypothetical protein ACUVQP_08545 [Bacteroidales bacterium]
MILKILAIVALIAVSILAAFGVVTWDKVIWLLSVLASFIIGQKTGNKKNNNNKV